MANRQRRNMSASREQMTARTKQLNALVDNIFEVFESVHEMLRNWKYKYHLPFIEQIMRLQKLEAALHALGYDEDFILTLRQTIYHSIFTDR
jgi:hypothetical protein